MLEDFNAIKSIYNSNFLVLFGLFVFHNTIYNGILCFGTCSILNQTCRWDHLDLLLSAIHTSIFMPPYDPM
jgi:hypothetical protein